MGFENPPFSPGWGLRWQNARALGLQCRSAPRRGPSSGLPPWTPCFALAAFRCGAMGDARPMAVPPTARGSSSMMGWAPGDPGGYTEIYGFAFACHGDLRRQAIKLGVQAHKLRPCRSQEMSLLQSISYAPSLTQATSIHLHCCYVGHAGFEKGRTQHLNLVQGFGNPPWWRPVGQRSATFWALRRRP